MESQRSDVTSDIRGSKVISDASAEAIGTELSAFKLRAGIKTAAEETEGR